MTEETKILIGSNGFPVAVNHVKTEEFKATWNFGCKKEWLKEQLNELLLDPMQAGKVALQEVQILTHAIVEDFEMQTITIKFARARKE